ncbi:MAG: type II toxin-antitoxin system death-on-curing family toxin, partial [Chloroflexota bacterium]
MRSLTIAEVLEIYQRVMQQTGGLIGILDFGAFESAIAQPYMTFGGKELYPSLAEKAAAPGFSLIQNHPFADGNKRTGHAVMAMFLALNG